jgi:hypothetical protein
VNFEQAEGSSSLPGTRATDLKRGLCLPESIQGTLTMAAPRSRDRRWTSSFARFIGSYGVTRLARELAIDPTAVYHWISGTTAPKPTLAVQICCVARQRRVTLSLIEIYRHGELVRARRIAAAERRAVTSAATSGAAEIKEKASLADAIFGEAKIGP